MDTYHEQFEALFRWIQGFDAHRIANEAEVKPEFVAPLFEHLGYPKECCRHEYPVPVYDPETRKRLTTLRVDQIYFSTAEADHQTADTSLLIIETKRPGDTNLDKTLAQARTYSFYLSPLFLVATDALWLHIVKRHSHRREETIFSDRVEVLRDRTKALQLYNDLHFVAVQHLKSLAETIHHALLVDMVHALGDHPNLQTELANRDFRPECTQNGRRMVVKESKVSLTCTLPLAFGDGECHIQFNNLLLRGLVCSLTHQQILVELLPGLNCGRTRHFLRKTESGHYKACLGNTTVMLPEREATELCHCVDVVGAAYRAAMMSAENTLETWNYTPASIPEFRVHGFQLRTVPAWLWKCIKQFADEHDSFTGDSVWHTFDRSITHLKIIHPYMKLATLIIPRYNFEADDITLIYSFEDDDTLEFQEKNEKCPWQQTIGPHGRWTAQYTDQWLIEHLIPHVLEYYEERGELDPTRVFRWRLSIMTASGSLSPLAQATSPQEFAPHVKQIQQWLHSCRGGWYLSSEHIGPYYAGLIDLVHNSDPSKGAVVYCRKHLVAAEIALYEEQNSGKSDGDSRPKASEWFEEAAEGTHSQQVEWLMRKLDKHIHRISATGYEFLRVAEYLTSVLISLLQEKTRHYEQEQLNQTRKALQPLLDLSQFEERFVLQAR